MSQDSGMLLQPGKKRLCSWCPKHRKSVLQWLTNEREDGCVEPHKAMPVISTIAPQVGAVCEKGIAAKEDQLFEVTRFEDAFVRREGRAESIRGECYLEPKQIWTNNSLNKVY